MSRLVKMEPCPKCRAYGADTRGNNLARYADGSAWCFAGHGMVERANRIPVIDDKYLQKQEEEIVLDDDLCNDFPDHIISWLAKYEITIEEVLKYGWKYSPSRNQLVFIFKDEYGNISCTQARNFSPSSKRKYFNQGNANDTLPIFWTDSGSSKSSKMVVTEDAISAAKISRQCDAIPCLGSHMSKSKLRALRLLGYEQMILWLDEDKLKEARSIAEQAKWLGFETRVIYTPLDPKEYSDEEIKEFLK